MKYLELDNIDCYTRAFVLSNYIWNIVINWNFLEQKTVGFQFITATDSISANLAEGFGRYNKKIRSSFTIIVTAQL